MKSDQALCKPTNPVGEGLAPPVWNEIRSSFIETAGASPRPTASYFIWLNFIKKDRPMQRLRHYDTGPYKIGRKSFVLFVGEGFPLPPNGI